MTTLIFNNSIRPLSSQKH